ncbi:hypothetical protein T4D_205 [Trichinella pseudospiralis]|uniref:Secreted protein n=1 Tax=Trichinella pseudospiralis TaxID=6337 RepID=A0A0V1F4F3_TRIPS|nr:hypothetical protein T4D_205 [Trichinella pseudospiralis]
MWPGQLELWIFFFFFFQKPSCPRHRWHCTSEAERTLWARLPIRCGPKPSCPCHRWHGTSEAERTLWARLPGRCGPVSWSFGSFFFFFFLQKPSLSLSPGALSTSCSFEVRFFSLWGHFWATSPGCFACPAYSFYWLGSVAVPEAVPEPRFLLSRACCLRVLAVGSL